MNAEQKSAIVTEQLTQRLKKAITAIDRLEGRLKKEIDAKSEPIAILGIGCRFPGGAHTPEQFWELLANGDNAVSEVPAGRWDINQYFDDNPDAPGKISSRFGGFLTGVDQFDAGFFEISPREAASLDPQQRLLLEVTWEALENANVVPASLYGANTGVFVAMSGSDYMLAQAKYAGEDEISAYFGAGNAHAAACGRLSYTLGCHGPSFSVDTACSSSLVALHAACNSLRSGESDSAIVASSNLMLTPDISITFSKAHMLAPDGRCKTFDAAADGYVRGEAVAAVYLKRLADAVRDGDPVRAVILGSAINQDGPSAGLTVPNGVAQQAVIKQALKNARINPNEVDYVEAHGTGTSLGDPIEIGALGVVYGRTRPPEKPLLVGSVKTNIGHCEASAGMAGLIKLVLSLEHGEIPRHLNFTTPSPLIPWANLNIAVAATHQVWHEAAPENKGLKIAGLSAFGFGGTNGHIIVASAPAAGKKTNSADMELNGGSAPAERSAHILKLSAKTPRALADLARRYAAALALDGGMKLADFAYTVNTCRSDFLFRDAAVAADRAGMLLALEKIATASGAGAQGGNLAFLFAGQGSQYAGMGRELYASQPVFRAVIDESGSLLCEHLAQPLTEVLWGEDQSLLNETQYTQPALFALELALARLWESWGIVPAAVLGHSVGEYAAACFAGVFSLADGLKLIAARGRLMTECCQRGSMTVVFAPVDIVTPLLAAYAGRLSVGAVNGPKNTVVSGESDALAAFIAELDQAAIGHQALSVSHAFHSPMMAPMLDAFAQVANSITYHRPRLCVISNLTGQDETDALAQASYWIAHISAPVKFAQGFEALAEQGIQTLVEVGPGSTLLGMGRRVLEARDDDLTPFGWLTSLRRGLAEDVIMLQSLAQLYRRAAAVDWKAFDAPFVPHARHRVLIPTYPFQYKAYWYAYPFAAPMTGARAGQTAIETAWLSSLRGGDLAPLEAQLSTQSLSAESRRVLDDVLKQLQALSAQGNGPLLTRVGARLHWEALQPLAGGVLSGRILLLADDEQEVRHLRAALTAAGAEVTLLLPAEWDALPAHRGAVEVERVIFCRNADNPALLAHTLLRSLSLGSARSELWVITRGAVMCQESDHEFSGAQACVWGVCNALAAELPEQFKAVLDLPLFRPGLECATDTALSEWHAAQAEAKIAHLSDSDQVAVRGDGCYVPRLQPWTPDAGVSTAAMADTTVPAFSADASYLVTGAFGGLGLVVTDWLVAQGARHLLLVSRGGARSEEAKAALVRWAAQQVNVQILSVDVAEREALLLAYESLRVQLPPLKGIFHLAGISGAPTASAELGLDDLVQVLRPKV
ncbi:MAG: SDR family NAD(P)-dependent oxidoreductase, partial [Aquabacterium sp.]|nr:SDR family NAD(P)-dependent oxidoreductase [Aquabacterium sp.]